MTSATALFVASLLAQSGAPASPAFDGRTRQVHVPIPRIEQGIAVDGALDEPVWGEAATLSGFSQYAPADGRAAESRTDVLVWYSPTAIHFGIRAYGDPSSVRATLAQRDRIEADDAVEIYLGTFNDRRQALLFGVNPLGVQVDGNLVEGTRTTGGGFGGISGGREAADLSQDFVFDSKGRLTDFGYQVEVRIPFKTLRYQPAATQDWSIHIVRRVQNTGHEDSWVPASRSASSFLSQSGTLQGLTGLRRGVVLDLTPVVTARADGARETGGSGWSYDPSRPDFGGNVRWGVTSNLTLNGTINPDFSQVEADATQIQFDPRQALFFQEKRPFFLDGLEQFATPNNLIYTRAIVAPLGAAKLTGKVRGTSVGFLTAIDDQAASRTGDNNPFFAIARVQRDLPGNARVAAVYTDRTEDGYSNRVVGVDARVPFARVYAIDLQGAIARDDGAGGTGTAPLWQASINRNGRRYSFRYRLQAVDEEFRTASGFIQRPGIADLSIVNQLAFYGPKGSWFERYTGDITLNGTWRYNEFTNGQGAQDEKLHFNNNFLFRGGWRAGFSYLTEHFGYPHELYTNHRVAETAPDGTVTYRPFTGTAVLPNHDWLVQAGTPRVRGVQANLFVLWGQDDSYFEWASAKVMFLNGGLFWRPTERVRVDLTQNIQTVNRRTDGSLTNGRYVTRSRVEYQLTRAMSVRWIGEFVREKQSALRDDTRTGLPLVTINPSTGVVTPFLPFERRVFRSDVLFSWLPTPGTVFFAGYGSTETDNDPRVAPGLVRARDGFFMKLSYLFRM